MGSLPPRPSEGPRAPPAERSAEARGGSPPPGEGGEGTEDGGEAAVAAGPMGAVECDSLGAQLLQARRDRGLHSISARWT